MPDVKKIKLWAKLTPILVALIGAMGGTALDVWAVLIESKDQGIETSPEKLIEIVNAVNKG